VVAALRDLSRREVTGVRWTGPGQWHVTLRFLGTVDIGGAVSALGRLRGSPAARAELGTDVVRLGREVIALPVVGLGGLADAVDAAFDGLGQSTKHGTFRGHLTLGRGTGVRAGLAGRLAERLWWPVESVSLVRSHLGRGGARYETVASVELASP
jgi:2'-5' RNA ligase